MKCIESTASRNMATNESRESFVSCFAIRNISGSIRTPVSAPMKRQPNGVMPNSRMPTMISSLPRCGCDHSSSQLPSVAFGCLDTDGPWSSS